MHERVWTLLAVALLAATAASEAGPRQAPVALLDVPYLPQSEALCGGAAAAMVMRYWGATGVYAETFADLVDPQTEGIRGDDLLKAVAERGWEARSFRGDARLLRSHLDRRRPIVALIEDRPGRFHYVVVVSWPDGRVLLHDPARAPYRILPEPDFLRAWKAAGYWAMLVLPGGRAPDPHAKAADGGASSASSAPCGGMVNEGVRLAGSGELDAAERLFELAAAACPLASGPRREIAGLYALRQSWREAAVEARRATKLDSNDQHAWRILATASYLQGDREGALDAWNEIGEPTVDLVNISGLDRTRYEVAARAIGMQPHGLLTAGTLRRAQRRLRELPSAQAARVAYRPGGEGRAQVDAVTIERPLLPTSAPSLAAAGVHMISDRELAGVLASPSGGGEVWSVAWRWWANRPRVALGFAAPAPFGGVWRVEAFDERQTYGGRDRVVVERRRGAVLGLADWLGADTRWDLRVSLDRWRGRGRSASIGGAVERHLADDALVVSARAEGLFGSVETWTAAAHADWRSSTAHEGGVWTARAGFSVADDDAPFALWSGAGTGPRSDVLLRAHPVLESGRVDRAVFGRRLLHAGAEWRWWVKPVRRVVRLAPAFFVDVARASRGGAFSDTRGHVDVGTGLRFAVPGAGVIGIDVGRGLRDGNMALSIGWRR